MTPGSHTVEAAARRPALFDGIRESSPSPGVEFVRSASELASIRGDWERLSGRRHSPIGGFDWYSACAESFVPPGSLRILLLRHEGRVRAIAPLVIRRRMGLRRIEILGAAELMEPTFLLFEDSEWFVRLLETMLRFRLPVTLRRLTVEPDLLPLLRAAAGRSWAVTVENDSTSPWIPLSGSWDEFEQRLSAKRRSTLRRSWRRAVEYGRMEFRAEYPGTSSVDAHLDEAVGIDGASWKENAGTSLGSSPEIRSFFRAFALSQARGGRFCAASLRCNSIPIAVVLGVVHARRFWVLRTSFNPAYGRCSPGILTLHQTIRHALERGLEGYEFLGADEEWIGMWTPEQHRYTTLRIFPLTPWSVAHAAIEGATILAHRMNNRRRSSSRPRSGGGVEPP